MLKKKPESPLLSKYIKNIEEMVNIVIVHSICSRELMEANYSLTIKKLLEPKVAVTFKFEVPRRILIYCSQISLVMGFSACAIPLTSF